MQLVHIGKLNGGVILQPEILEPSEIDPHAWFPNEPQGKSILWTSPSNSTLSWGDWVEEAYPQRKQGLEQWTLELSSRARIAMVNSAEDVETLLARFPGNSLGKTTYINWVRLAQAYDALWLTENGALEARLRLWEFNALRLFSCWDCETVVVFNTAVVKIGQGLPKD